LPADSSTPDSNIISRVGDEIVEIIAGRPGGIPAASEVVPSKAVDCCCAALSHTRTQDVCV